MPPTLRHDGRLKQLKVPALDDQQVQQMLYDLMSDRNRKLFENDLELDFSISIQKVGRFRVNAFNQLRGPAAVFRVIPTEVLSLKALSAPPIFENLAMRRAGLVLVTGPTGSGKSTTLAAMVDHVNENRGAHILTIEDPIEFVHKAKKSVINQRELNEHTTSFARALKSALREDPDVILIGELRDVETIRLALTAAETGHLVLGTLHTSSAAKTIDRVVDVFDSAEKDMIRTMLSESLSAIIAQTLLKKPNGGRVAAHEILIATPAIRNLIRENKIPQIYSALQTGAGVGMRTMSSALDELVDQRIINREIADAHNNNQLD